MQSVRTLSVATLILVVSTLFLSALFDNLTSYYTNLPPQEESSPSKSARHLVFAVSPAHPTNYWRVSTSDYYDGFRWSSTTIKRSIEEFPKAQSDSDVQVFTVEMNTTEEEVSLPVPSSKTSVSNPKLSPHRDYELRLDDMADVYGIRIPEQGNETEIVYEVAWNPIDYSEIDERLISLDDVPQEIRSVYLQLPSLPEEVWELARRLNHNSYNVLDQIFADVQYLRTYFDYDVELWENQIPRAINHDWVFSYIQRRKGVCVDAATALTVILRCQDIPARMSFGFKPEKTHGNKTYFYSTGAHAETEVYLPPYGWVRFDATPPFPDSPRLEVTPIKAEGYFGEDVFYHLGVTNKRNVTDRIKMSIHSEEKWNGKVISDELIVRPFETKDTLIKITIPQEASSGETNVFTVHAKSLYYGKEFSVMAISEIGKAKRVSTITKINSVDQYVFRGDYFSVEGEVYTENAESVHGIPVFVLLSKTEEEKSIVVGRSSPLIEHLWMDCQMPLCVEQGIYSLFAISLGDSKHAPSISLPAVVTVRARTSLKLNVKSPTFVGDQPTVYGHLLLDDGASVQNACITLEAQFQENSSINWKWQTFTDANGVFLTIYEQRFMNPGLFELNVAFLGDKYMGGYNATQTISVDFGTPTIQIFTGSRLIRGEVCLVHGIVRLNDTGIWKEPVTIAFDDRWLSTVETDFNGLFSYELGVNPEEEVGNHTLSFIIQPRSLKLSQEVNVMGKTEFNVTSSTKVSGKELLSLSASLLDDHGLPVPEADIFMENCGLAGKTDRDGNVRFLLGSARFLPENMNLTLRFEGSEIYLPTATSVTVAAEPVIPIAFLFPVVISAAFVLAFVTNRSLFYKKRTKQQEKPLAVKSTQETLLTIRFPDIRSSFPNVWGVGEELRIICLPNGRMQKKAEGRTVELLVNGKKTAESVLLKGCATFSQIFETKGIYQVMARLIGESRPQTATSETTLRVVSYREEIVNLYRAFLRFIDQKCVEIEDEMTAREIESLLLSTGKFDAENLQRVTDCFEKSEYSIHSIKRKDYETIYQSLKELEFDAGKIN